MGGILSQQQANSKERNRRSHLGRGLSQITRKQGLPSLSTGLLAAGRSASSIKFKKPKQSSCTTMGGAQQPPSLCLGLVSPGASQTGRFLL